MQQQRPHKGKIIVFGILFWYPLAGVTYQFLALHDGTAPPRLRPLLRRGLGALRIRPAHRHDSTPTPTTTSAHCADPGGARLRGAAGLSAAVTPEVAAMAWTEEQRSSNSIGTRTLFLNVHRAPRFSGGAPGLPAAHLRRVGPLRRAGASREGDAGDDRVP